MFIYPYVLLCHSSASCGLCLELPQGSDWLFMSDPVTLLADVNSVLLRPFVFLSRWQSGLGVTRLRFPVSLSPGGSEANLSI